MTSKPDCQYTGIPLIRPHWKTTGATGTLGCHWNHTGWCLHPVVFQWRSSVNLHNWNTGRPLEPQVHWDATGTTLADASTQWCPSGDPVLICIIGTHWKTTGKPLEAHWHFSSGIPVYTGVYVPGTLEDHWLRVRVPSIKTAVTPGSCVTNIDFWPWSHL